MIEIPMEWANTLRMVIETAVEHIEEYDLEHLFDIDIICELYATVGGNRDDLFWYKH